RLIHQELSLVPELQVAENIFLGREPQAYGFVRRGIIEDAARQVLDRLGVAIDVRARVATLPVAKRQIVEIARALAGDARLLAMDEPTSALNPEEAARLHQLIRTLAKNGAGIIYVSHRLEELAAIADRLTVLRDGQAVATRPMRELPIPELVRLMVG